MNSRSTKKTMGLLEANPTLVDRMDVKSSILPDIGFDHDVSPEPGTPTHITQWEYLVLAVHDREKRNDAGLEGWEAFAVDMRNMYFKRRI